MRSLEGVKVPPLTTFSGYATMINVYHFWFELYTHDDISWVWFFQRMIFFYRLYRRKFSVSLF